MVDFLKHTEIANEDCIKYLTKNARMESIDLVVTSPPYFNAREYSEFEHYDDYLTFMYDFFVAVKPVMKIGARICVNVPDGYGRNPYHPIYADIVHIMQRLFVLRGSIVWDKNTTGNRTTWGSWRSASNPALRDQHEMVVVAHKEYPKIVCERDTIGRDEFMEYTRSIWDIPPELPSKVNHPAPFPVELPKRLIELYSSPNGIVLDPFMGSGTTAIACFETGRVFLGIEKNFEYFEVAMNRMYDWIEKMKTKGSQPEKLQKGEKENVKK